MKKKLFLFGLIVALLVLPLLACAKPAPTPTPTPTPQPQQPVQLMLSAGRVGDYWYALGEAIAFYVNKSSSWLKVTAAASPGLGAGHELVISDPKTYAIMASGASAAALANNPKFNNYDRIRWIATVAPVSWIWVTYDANIKTMQDFAGKNVGVTRNLAEWPDTDEMLRRAGVLDKVTVHRLAIGSAVDALRDGKLQATYMLMEYVWPATFAKGANITQLETRAPVYYVSVDPQAVSAMGTIPAGKLLPEFASVTARVYPGALDPKTQPNEAWIAFHPSFVGVDESMDEAVAYELARVIYENAEQFATWHAMGKNMSKTFIPTYAYNEKLMHPGALRYYQEHGIKVKNLAELLPSR